MLLDQLWKTLAPGGLMVYVTCSILKAENSQQIESFMHRHQDARENVITDTWGQGQSHGRQILLSDNCDGFYYACLQKT